MTSPPIVNNKGNTKNQQTPLSNYLKTTASTTTSKSPSTSEERVIDKITTSTDINNFTTNKKMKLFEEVCSHVDTSKVTLSKELRFLIRHMFKTAKQLHNKNRELQESIDKSNNNAMLSNNQNTNNKPSYSEVLKIKRPQHILIIKDTSNSKINLRKKLIEKLKSEESNIDIIDIKNRNEMLIVELKDEDQIKIVCNKFKTDSNIKCILPSKHADQTVKEIIEQILNIVLINRT